MKTPRANLGTLDKVVPTAVASIAIINIVFTVYIIFKTITLIVNKCTCVTKNIYWIYIFFYLFYGLVFLGYLLLQTWGILPKSRVITYFSTLFVVFTILFIVASFEFTKYIKNSKCDCLNEEYKKLLDILTKIRLFAILLGVFAFIGWAIYVTQIRSGK